MRPGGDTETIKVWDIVVRLSHWTLVAAIALAWFTSEGYGRWHEYIGYLALAVVFLRVLWGFTGTRYARFTQFIRSLPHTLAYARSVIAGRQPRYLGHNPLAGWMALVLLIMTLLTCVTGWLYTTDRFWGVEWMEELHEVLSYAMLPLIALHIIGAIATSRHHRENLIASMVHGRKHAAGRDDID
jgi:cytochrome b